MNNFTHQLICTVLAVQLAFAPLASSQNFGSQTAAADAFNRGNSIPDISKHIPNAPIQVDFVNRQPGEVTNWELMTPEQGAAAMASSHRDGGITASTALSIINIQTSDDLNEMQKERALSIITNNYYEFSKGRKDDPNHDPFEAGGQMFSKNAQDFASASLGFAVRELAPFATLGLRILDEKLTAEQKQQIEQFEKHHPELYRKASLNELQIYKSYVQLAQGNLKVQHSLTKGKFFLSSKVDPNMKKADYFTLFPAAKLLEQAAQKKPAKSATTKAEKDAEIAADAQIQKSANQTIAEYDKQMEQAIDKMKKEADLAQRKELAEEINMYGKSAANALFLASLLLKDPGDKKGFQATGRLVMSVASAVADLTVSWAKYGPLLATGNFYVAIALAVFDFVSPLTGPSQEELVLNAIKDLREHLIQMENRIHAQLNRIEGRLQEMSLQINELMKVVVNEFSITRNQGQQISSHLRYIEEILRLSDLQMLSIHYEQKKETQTIELTECIAPENSAQFIVCLNKLETMANGTADTVSIGGPWLGKDWASLPPISSPFFNQLGVLRSSSMALGDPSLSAIGIRSFTSDGLGSIRPVNPIEWADIAQKFALFVRHNLDLVRQEPAAYRSTLNSILQAGDTSAKAFLRLGARKGTEEELKDGKGTNAILAAIETYSKNVSDLQKSVEGLRKEFETNQLAGYPLNELPEKVLAHGELIPKRIDQVGERKTGVLSGCVNGDQILKDSVKFESAKDLKNAISSGHLASRAPGWPLKILPEYGVTTPNSIRIHHDLGALMGAFVRERDDLLASKAPTQKKIHYCIESISWAKRFSLAHFANDRSLRNFVYKEIIDDEGVWKKCSDEEKRIVNNAHALLNGRNHFGQEAKQDYLSLSAEAIGVIDAALAIGAKYGSDGYSRFHRADIESVFEFGYPSMVVRAYYATGSGDPDSKHSVVRVRFTSKKPVQFGAALVDYQEHGTPAAWAALEAAKRSNPKVTLPSYRSTSSVPEITGPFAGRYYYSAHGNLRMNHFRDVEKAAYDGTNQLIPEHGDKHQPLDEPLLIQELVAGYVAVSNALGEILSKNEGISLNDFTSRGFEILPASEEEKREIQEADKDLLQYWTAQRIQFDQISLMAVRGDASYPSLSKFPEVQQNGQRVRKVFSAIQGLSYLAFPTSSTSEQFAGELLFGKERQTPLNSAWFDSLSSKTSSREWKNEFSKNPNERNSIERESSIDPGRNPELYQNHEARLLLLKNLLSDLSSKRTPHFRAAETGLANSSGVNATSDIATFARENVEPHPILERNMSMLRGLNLYVEAGIPKESLLDIHQSISRFLRDKYQK
jgi:hypothetical protein